MTLRDRAGRRRYIVVHDESGNVSSDMYFACGLLVLPRESVDDVVAELQSHRKATGYWGEIHFNRLRNLPGRENGEKASVASGWLEGLPNLVDAGLRCYVLVVNREAASFEGVRMPKPRHLAYNRYTRMAMESAIRWFFRETDDLEIRIVSDARHRLLPGGDDEFSDGDNFVEYLPRAVGSRVNGEISGWPTVRFRPREVQLVDTSEQLGSNESELLQLTDLVTSASRAAVSGKCSTKPGKRLVAEVMSSVISDVARAPWQQQLGLHRRVGFAEFQGQGFAAPVTPRLGLLDQQAIPF